jgi:hypothetical protein
MKDLFSPIGLFGKQDHACPHIATLKMSSATSEVEFSQDLTPTSNIAQSYRIALRYSLLYYSKEKLKRSLHSKDSSYISLFANVSQHCLQAVFI